MASIGVAVRPPGRFAKAVATMRKHTTRVAGQLLTPHRASLARLADIPLTVAGAACIDFAGFHLAHGWGWLVTGGSLLVLEHLIADPDN